MGWGGVSLGGCSVAYCTCECVFARLQVSSKADINNIFVVLALEPS